MMRDNDTHDDESRFDRYDDRFVEGRHLLDYVKVLYKRRWTVMSVFLIVVINGTAQTFTETPRYRAHARILLEVHSPNVVDFEEVINDNQYYDYYETQLRLLESRALARRTLENLGLWQHPVLTGAVAGRSFSARRLVSGAAATAVRWAGAGGRALLPASPDPPDPDEYAWQFAAGGGRQRDVARLRGRDTQRITRDQRLPG